MKRIIRVACGNFLEMYDFMVFAYFAIEISKAYFPAQSEFASLMMTLATFGAGYLMRPIGAVVLGSYIDRHGRRDGLLLTLALMSVGTVTLALMPSYQTVGLAAPVVILLARLLQGFSAGAELGGVSVYLSEIATPGNKGFYVSWQSASQQVAVMFAALLGLGLTRNLTHEQMESWGWRIPLLVGCLIVPVLFYIRGSLEETAEFAKHKKSHGAGEIFKMLLQNWRFCINGMGLVLMTTVSFYFITAYTPTFGRKELHLSALDSLYVTLIVGASNLLWLPLAGAVSDRIGRRPILYVAAGLALVSAYPALAWLADAPSFPRLVSVELWLSFLYAVYNGAMVCYLTEIMPPRIRTTGFSVAYSLATSLGGFTALICTWLIKQTGNAAIPGLWLGVAAGFSLLAIRFNPRQSARSSF